MSDPAEKRGLEPDYAGPSLSFPYRPLPQAWAEYLLPQSGASSRDLEALG
jgi:hypothetical protein